MATDQIEKKEYEISFLAKDEMGPQEVVKLIKRFEGEITSEGSVEKIALAYPIKHEKAAYFGWLHMAMEPANITPLEHELEVHPGVLRTLIITPPFVKAKPRQSMKPGAKPSPEPKTDKKKTATLPLTNEALEKKIEEILHE